MDPDSLGLPAHTFDYGARLLAATALGGAIGLDREAKDRPAGLRTHMLTSLAAALFTILTLQLHLDIDAVDPDAATDPLRIIEAVTAGVAFLAAGAIIQGRGKVQGLTTGAGMWLAGAVGVACGSAHYVLAVVAVILAAIVLAVLRPLEKRLVPKSNHKPRAEGEPPSEETAGTAAPGRRNPRSRSRTGHRE